MIFFSRLTLPRFIGQLQIEFPPYLTLNSKKKKVHILKDYCMGCGSCVVGCKHKALTFELVRPPEHIPERLSVPMPLASMPGTTIVREESLK